MHRFPAVDPRTLVLGAQADEDLGARQPNG
jgi:hypothetical protein